MTKQTPIISWFEIVTQDLNRAIHFYEAVFSIKLRLEKNPKMTLAIFPYPEEGTGGALVHGECFKQHKGNSIIVYLNTDKINTTLQRVEQAGGKTVFPCTDIGEHGFIAGFEDSEGNMIGIWSNIA